VTLPIAEQILEDMLGVLQTLGGTLGAFVDRDRDEKVTTFPTIVLEDRTGATEYDLEQSYATSVKMEVDVDGYVQAATGASVGTAMAVIEAQIHNALVADRQRGALAIDTQLMTSLRRSGALPNADGGGNPVGAVALTFVVTFQTAQNDLTAPPGV
jgi:hypothetical protein